ncbi:MAG: GNAT family N-acetyltransferase [Gammaproteobacteria bacterium]|nr:GNAT family N-acetyltransferase [Gammaproteobacteria bacterium]MCD8542075.1 GNAT family N-acetyltransferase [Gammaproteobacteria bacterium]MCD8573867.1 GNAT family N-acetyltransferase [Gammaproteobacteria bacterium]
MNYININTWDSDLFGFSMASIISEVLDPNILCGVDAECRENSVTMLQYLCASEDIHSIHQAEKAGFHFIDIRLTFEAQLGPHILSPEKIKGLDFTLANESHIQALLSISAGLYKDTRYYADLNFPRDKVSVVYDRWVVNAVHGTFDHLCYGLFTTDQAIGFCTVRFIDDKRCVLGLVGIAETYQRQSFGTYLLQLVMVDLYERGFSNVRVVTQGKNIGAQRTYQGLQFKTSRVDMWYHKWNFCSDGIHQYLTS